MKSKLFTQCEQRIHPVLNIYYYSLIGWYWTPGDTQSDPQSCRVRSLGAKGGAKNKQRIKRPKQNWAVRRPIVTKRSIAKANAEKGIPPAMSQRNQHLTHAMLQKPATTTPKQFQTTWCFGKDWQPASFAPDWAGNLQSATVFPGILHLQKRCCLLKLRQFWQKRVTAAISFSGP